MDEGRDTVKLAVLSVNLKDAASVHDYFMPGVRGGGLFVETSRSFPMGSEVFLLLTLPDGEPRVPVPGRVMWITPSGNRDGRQPGIGVQFKGEQAGLMMRIQNILLSVPAQDKESLTF